ncbi:hypothetical protein D3C87_1132300 [compost metagenome]
MARRFHAPALRHHVRPAADQFGGQGGRHRRRVAVAQLRGADLGAGIRALARQRRELVPGQRDDLVDGGKALARGGQGRLGLLHVEGGVELRIHAPARQVQRVLALAVGLLGQRALGVGGVEPQVGAHDGRGQYQFRRVVIDLGGAHAVQRGVERGLVLAPEVEFVAEAKLHVTGPLPAACERAWHETVLAEALARGPGAQVDLRIQGGFGTAGERIGLAHPRGGDTQRGLPGQRRFDQRGELRIAKAFPPGAVRPGGRRQGRARERCGGGQAVGIFDRGLRLEPRYAGAARQERRRAQYAKAYPGRHGTRLWLRHHLSPQPSPGRHGRG